jgi:hypothetical protein
MRTPTVNYKPGGDRNISIDAALRTPYSDRTGKLEDAHEEVAESPSSDLYRLQTGAGHPRAGVQEPEELEASDMVVNCLENCYRSDYRLTFPDFIVLPRLLPHEVHLSFGMSATIITFRPNRRPISHRSSQPT